jgi:hypothetical protein
MHLIPPVRRTRPDLVAGLSAPLLFAPIIDAVGQVGGYPLGAGQAAQKVARLEFRREAGDRD